MFNIDNSIACGNVQHSVSQSGNSPQPLLRDQATFPQAMLLSSRNRRCSTLIMGSVYTREEVPRIRSSTTSLSSASLLVEVSGSIMSTPWPSQRKAENFTYPSLV